MSEPTKDSLEIAFPGVECGRGVSGRCVARLRGNPMGPVVAEGEDWADLRDALRKRRSDMDDREWLARREASNSGG